MCRYFALFFASIFSTGEGACLVSSCPSATTTCSSSADNYICKDLTYSTSTGIFTGTIVTNTCPNYKPTASPAATCASYSIPSITTTPSALAFGGQLGFLLNGQLLYGSIEQGISCTTDTTGTCASGLDVATCKIELIKYCPSTYKTTTSMADTCGFHASPYHCHTAPASSCTAKDYSAGHSPLIAIANDGRGIYGLYETTNAAPTNLDACNGHNGVISATAGYPDATAGIAGFASAGAVYHYHVSSTYPYTIGCYGSSQTVSYSACTKLTQTSGANTYDNNVFCGSFVPVYSSTGSTDSYYYVDDYCQCGTGTQTMTIAQASVSTTATCWPYFGGWKKTIAGTSKQYPTGTDGYKNKFCSKTPTIYTGSSDVDSQTAVSGLSSHSLAGLFAAVLFML